MYNNWPNITGESDVEQRMLSAKVTRLNITELYQHLNAESILQQMVDRQLILPEKMTDAVAYTHKYAQNSVAISALFTTRSSPPMFLMHLCDVLEATGNSQQLKLATKLRSGMFTRFLDATFIVYSLFPDHKRHNMSQRKTHVLRPSHVPSSPVTSGFSELQGQFLQMLQSVMESFDQHPNSLSLLKQFHGQLVLPLGEGKTVPIVDPSRYEKATTSRDMFRQLSVLWNSFSPDLLKMLCEECQCCPAMEAVEQFILFRSYFANSLLCRQTQSVDDSNDPNNSTTPSSPLHPSHLSYHTGPISDLQSLHPSVFQCLDEHKRVEPRETIRLTVQLNRPHLTLQDYDDIATAVCGYFEIPRVALVYGGCSCDGQVLCWMTSARLLQYMKNVNIGISSYRLMSERSVLGVAAGDLRHHCLRMKVILYEICLILCISDQNE